MKKFLIVVILLIPIIVVFALSATSSILSLVTPDNPTGILVRDSFNSVVNRDSIISLDIKDFSEFIMVDILPFMTKEDGLNTPEYDENNTGEVLLEHVPNSNKYKIVPVKVGIATIILSAKANVNVRRSVTFNVKSETIDSLNIYAKMNVYSQDERERTEQIVEIDAFNYFSIVDECQLYVDIHPIEALKDYQVFWNVVKGNSVSVSSNGKLKILGRGLSQVRVSAWDKGGNYSTKDMVIDTTDAIVKSRKVMVVVGQSEQASFLQVQDEILLDVDNSSLVAVNENEYKVTHTNPETQEERVAYIHLKKTVENDWDFIDKFGTVYTNNGPYFLGVEKIFEGKIIDKVIYTSSDTSVIDINRDLKALVPKKAGHALVIAEYDGAKKEMEIVVRERVPVITLEYGAEHSKLGIQLIRKWGQYFLDEDNEITSTLDFGLLEKTNLYDVIWESSDSRVISFERKPNSQDLTLDFSPESLGKSATITAYMNINGRKYDSTKSSFTFNFLGEEDYVNVFNFEQIKFLSIEEKYNICLQSDILAPETVNYFIGPSYYGNGFLYDSSIIPDKDFNYLFIGAINVFRAHFAWAHSGLNLLDGKEIIDGRYIERPITFEEIRFQNAKTIEESPSRGAAVFINEWYAEALITFKYIQAKNSEYGLGVKIAKNVHVEGCILGDNATYSLYTEWVHERDVEDRYINASPPTPAKITIKNCVFKHSDGPAINFLYNSSLNPEELKINFLPEVHIEGFLDVYNWHSQESFANIFSKIIIRALAGSFGMDEPTQQTMRKILGNVFSDYFKTPELSDLYYVYNNKKYVSVALLGMGAVFRPNMEKIQCDDPRLRIDQVLMTDSSGKPLTSAISGLDFIVKQFLNIETILNPSVFVVYDSVGREPAIMPGEPVPQSYELYARLTGFSEDLYI